VCLAQHQKAFIGTLVAGMVGGQTMLKSEFMPFEKLSLLVRFNYLELFGYWNNATRML
jgi:hypothetical protein